MSYQVDCDLICEVFSTKTFALKAAKEALKLGLAVTITPVEDGTLKDGGAE